MKLLFFYIISVSVLILYCTANIEKQNPGFSKSADFSSNSNELSISKDPIDKFKTYELFFYLPADEEKILIDIAFDNSTSSKDADSAKDKSTQVYFIIEKAIDSSGYGEKFSFSPISTNFGNNWKPSSKVSIDTDPSDPIKKLTKGPYKIRFTAFSEIAYGVKITILSNNKQAIISKEFIDFIENTHENDEKK